MTDISIKLSNVRKQIDEINKRFIETKKPEVKKTETKKKVTVKVPKQKPENLNEKPIRDIKEPSNKTLQNNLT